MPKTIELKDNETIVDIKALETLLTNIEKKDEQILQLYVGSIKLLSLLGLAADGKVKDELFSEDVNIIPMILKEATALMGLITMCQAPVIGKKYQAQLVEKFSFFMPLVPVFNQIKTEFEVKIKNEFKTT
jgi:hypothetical protein